MMPTCTAMTTDDAYLYCDDNWWCLPVLWWQLMMPTCTVIPFSFYSAINDGWSWQLMMPTCTVMITDDAYLYCDPLQFLQCNKWWMKLATDDAYLYGDDNWRCLPVQWSPSAHTPVAGPGWRSKQSSATVKSPPYYMLYCENPHQEQKSIKSNGIYIYMAQIHNTVSLT